MVNNYSDEFREAVVRRLLSENGPSITDLAEETGVSIASIWRWREKLSGELDLNGNKRPQDWSAEEKFLAILETAHLNEEELGSYCRRNGLTCEQLEIWKQTCISSIRKGPKVDPEKKNLEKELKSVKRELRRKEKALSETAALLVLKKKAAEIWGLEEEDD